MTFKQPVVVGASVLATSLLLMAQDAPPAAASATKPKPATEGLPDLVVTATASPSSLATPPLKQKYQLPQTTHSITANEIQDTVNAVDTEDALKYFPSLFLRKRNYGDTQATLATRTWGVNSSARSLVYADDTMLSALIGNNNTNGAPRWGLVSPQQIERIDVLYGPFAAAYPGNSMGGVVQITTKMPEGLVGDISQTEAFQNFDLYGTKDTYRTDQTQIYFGDKKGDFSWLFSGNFQNSDSQPLTIITNGSIPAGTTGAYPAANKLGAVADVVGAGGLLHTEMGNLNGKVAWDISPTLKATYEAGLFSNSANSDVQTYLRNAGGDPTFGGIKGFASNEYTLEQRHLANSFSLKTDTKDVLDWDFSLSNYYYLEDIQRNPYGVGPGRSFLTNGTIARLDGTNWTNSDLKWIYRPTGADGPHEVSFGLHGDRYFFVNPTYGTPTWTSGPDSTSTLYSKGEGTTMTEAIWAQDAWRFAPDFNLTLGGRLEFWQAFDGFNLSTKQTPAGGITSTTSINQPDLNDIRFSPKVSLDWTPRKEWDLTASFGQAYRFPTVTELYQTVTTGPILSNPNPNLQPENVLSEEISIQRKFEEGNLRLSLFNEHVSNAIISQTNFIGATPTTFVTNVDAIRNTGVELAAQKNDVFCHGIDLFGSVTYVDSEILRDPTFASTTGTTATGKHVPYVPDWRATFGVTYRPTDQWALTAAARYSGKQYSTLDNTDTTSNVFGAFDRFFVVDLRARYQVNKDVMVDIGIDNVANERYFLYHPFPQRTITTQVKVQF